MTTPSLRPESASLADYHAERMVALCDEECDILMRRMLVRSFSSETVGALMVSAAQVSATLLAKAELAAMSQATSADGAQIARDRVRGYFERAIPRLRDEVVEQTAKRLEGK